MNEYKFIDIKQLVSEDKLNSVESFETNHDLVTDVKVRNNEMKFYTYNKRLLWMAVGLEYIEPELLDWIDSFPVNTVMYDIGASNGPFSIYAAVRGIQVVACEPESQNYSVLEMNHYLNNKHIKHPIVTLNVALSNKNELGQIHCAKYEGGGHVKILDRPVTVGDKREFSPVHSQYVIKETLDGLISKYQLPFPDYIKIDVDGSEADVLEGAAKTLHNPTTKGVFIEIMEPDTEGREIVEYIVSAGYSLSKKIQVQRYEGLYNCIFER